MHTYIKMTPKEYLKEKKKKSLLEGLEIPSGVSASIEGDFLIIRGGKNEVSRKIISPVEMIIEGNKIILKCHKSTRRERKIFGTMKAHVKNMIKGVINGFKYKLQVASVHFPITVKLVKDKNEVHIKNFLGEKKEKGPSGEKDGNHYDNFIQAVRRRDGRATRRSAT